MIKENIIKKENCAHNREFASIFIVLGALVSLMVTGSMSGRNIMELWRQIFSQAHLVQLTSGETAGLAFLIFNNVFFILSPVFLAILVAGIAARLIQNKRLKVSARQIIPEFSRLNPVYGLRRIFSSASFLSLFRLLVSLIVIFLVAFIVIKSRFIESMPVTGSSVGQIFAFISNTALEILFKIALVIAVLALIEMLIQKYIRNNKSQRDPFSYKEMIAAVRNADVVVAHAEKICVTIRYDKGQVAPYVVAKGKGLMARNILDSARQNKVEIVENIVLANDLFSSSDIGQMVSESNYMNVAEILANVYRLKNAATV